MFFAKNLSFRASKKSASSFKSPMNKIDKFKIYKKSRKFNLTYCYVCDTINVSA